MWAIGVIIMALIVALAVAAGISGGNGGGNPHSSGASGPHAGRSAHAQQNSPSSKAAVTPAGVRFVSAVQPTEHEAGISPPRGKGKLTARTYKLSAPVKGASMQEATRSHTDVQGRVVTATQCSRACKPAAS